MKSWRISLGAAAAAILLGITGCQSTSDVDPTGDTSKPQIITNVYPLEFLAQRLGGAEVHVTNLVEPGVEAHDLELSPQQVAALSEADLVITIPGLQPAVDEAVAAQAHDHALILDRYLDTTSDSEAGVKDPHIWLDPTIMKQLALEVSDAITPLLGENVVAAQTDALLADLTELDAQWLKATETCESRDLLVSHAAFGYLTARYGFVQQAIAGLNPEGEPSANAIKNMIQVIRDSNGSITTIYYENRVDPGIAQTIAQEAGIEVGVLDPLESAPTGAEADYLSVMQENLVNVQQGQRCE